MSQRRSRLIKFIRNLKRAIRHSRMALYNSKYSNRIYNNHILTVLAVLREYLQLSYERLEDLLNVMDEQILSLIGLRSDRIPHFTTVNKFILRSRLPQLKAILRSFIALIKLKQLHIALDSTGYSIRRASRYYTQTLTRTSHDKIRRKNAKRPIRTYLKSTCSIDHRKQLLVAIKIRRGPSNDNIDFKPVVKMTAEGPQRVVSTVADKGYDAESNHSYCRRTIGAQCIIPLRRSRHRDDEVHGWFRRQMMIDFPKEKYGRRALIETVFSVIKRLMGDHIESRKVCAQNKQLILRGIAYNSHRMTVLFFII